MKKGEWDMVNNLKQERNERKQEMRDFMFRRNTPKTPQLSDVFGIL
jgi:hypothetical protein